MVKKTKILIPIIGLMSFAPISILLVPGKTNNTFSRKSINNDTKTILRIKNMADYIYVDEEDHNNDLIHQFERYCQEKGKNVEVIYETTDTNETLLTELQTGKSNYDLICPSEYMVQKMIAQDLLEPLNPTKKALLTNYNTYASSYVRNRLDNIVCPNSKGQEVKVGDFAVGYMWGTLGLVFNPSYNDAYKKDIFEDVNYYSIINDSKYRGTISIKDSVRDTYLAGLMVGYQDELKEYRNKYISKSDPSYNSEAYHNDIDKVANRCESKDIDVVKSAWQGFKNNMFGLEVDSGKLDIVQGKIGMNLAWSGDANYSIRLGRQEKVDLYYSVPLTGSNLWFDSWVIPKSKTPRSEDVEDAAYEFLNFISDPSIASKNMQATGYTSFIGGEAILDLVRSYFDNRHDLLVTKEDRKPLYFLAPLSQEETKVNYSHFFKPEDEDDKFKDVVLYYYKDDNVKTTYKIDGQDVKYNAYFKIPPTWEEVDLNYFFNNNFTPTNFTPDKNFVFYTTDYYKKDSSGKSSSAVGGEFYCQYPDYETIVRCAVMKDFGPQNDAILKMWEEFKSNALPLWAIILFVSQIGIIIVAIIAIVTTKHGKKKLRSIRKKKNL